MYNYNTIPIKRSKLTLVSPIGEKLNRQGKITLMMDLKSTLNLPNPDFTIPMKADLPTREPEIQKKWKELDIYHHIIDTRKGAPTFVLHDGPPYTNSPIHLGTALNKLLKDFVVKSHTMLGYRCPFVPGYDNHGLPIEQTVMRAFQERKESPDKVTLRKACREHAEKYIDIQTEQFKRLAIFGLWELPYKTMEFKFEAEVVRIFKQLVAEGYIYKGLKPVLWSPTSQTALADTEIIYQDHVSNSIYVKFPLLSDPNNFFNEYPNLSAIIWTTTPWTLPANVALAFHPELIYAIIRSGNEHFIVLESLAPKVMEKLGRTDWQQIGVIFGNGLETIEFKHPIFDRPSKSVMANYITTEDGTGIVHTAPGHGREDFVTGLKYGLPILCPVDEKGRMTAEAGEFAGLSYKECDQAVIDKLETLGNLLLAEKYNHSYPYAERDGKPVIFRATEQWFLSIDANELRKEMLEQIGEVTWLPQTGQSRIEAMISNRPDWCLSRQRPWGVGIPIFYGKQTRKPVMDPEAIEAVARLIEREGSDAWYDRDPKEILPPEYASPETGETEFTKETDVFDVWFDSGCTSLCVLEGRVHPEWKEPWPADIYLEGSDQHRGWFNTSLIIATALKDQAPYKTVVTHGFIVDQQGHKMSKRLGNVIDPLVVCDKYGADILRYWVASIRYEDDMPCSDEILKQCGDGYRRIRNTLRFLLSNLYDYNGLQPTGLHELDQWLIEQVQLLIADCTQSYRNYHFANVVNSIHNFCTQQISAFYADAIKDRMYCDGKDWPSRRSAQYTCQYTLLQLIRLIAPILPYTAEEVYERIEHIDKKKTVHTELIELFENGKLDEIPGNLLQRRFATLTIIRAEVFTDFEQWKLTSDIKDSQDVRVTITHNQEIVDTLKTFRDELPNYFKMSWVDLEVGEPHFEFRASEFLKCDRSRIRRPDVEHVGDINLSYRDRKVLNLA